MKPSARFLEYLASNDLDTAHLTRRIRKDRLYRRRTKTARHRNPTPEVPSLISNSLTTDVPSNSMPPRSASPPEDRLLESAAPKNDTRTLAEVSDCNKEVGDCNREARNCNREVGDCNKEVGDCNREAGNCNREVGDCNREAGNCNREVGDCNREVGDCNREAGEIGLADPGIEHF